MIKNQAFKTILIIFLLSGCSSGINGTYKCEHQDSRISTEYFIFKFSGSNVSSSLPDGDVLWTRKLINKDSQSFIDLSDNAFSNSNWEVIETSRGVNIVDEVTRDIDYICSKQ